MKYKEWFDSHAKKHKKIVEKLIAKGFTDEEVIDYFEFSNMAENEKEFCPLYAQNKKCHDIPYLSCYFCACPHFRFKDSGIKNIDTSTQYSYCSIESKDGKQVKYSDAIHQDCSSCIVPHTKKYVMQNFSFDWKEAMKECEL